jgi:hypothetical protein
MKTRRSVSAILMCLIMLAIAGCKPAVRHSCEPERLPARQFAFHVANFSYKDTAAKIVLTTHGMPHARLYPEMETMRQLLAAINVPYKSRWGTVLSVILLADSTVGDSVSGYELTHLTGAAAYYIDESANSLFLRVFSIDSVAGFATPMPGLTIETGWFNANLPIILSEHVFVRDGISTVTAYCQLYNEQFVRGADRRRVPGRFRMSESDTDLEDRIEEYLR